MFIPSYRLLPEPSILEKLKTLSPDAVNQIFDSFQKIAQTRRAEQSKVGQKTGLMQIFKRAFADSFFYYFHPVQNYRDTFTLKTQDPWTAASAIINRDWAVTGDDLRVAINAYMQEKNITPQQIGCSEKEIESLRYVGQEYTALCQRPPQP